MQNNYSSDETATLPKGFSYTNNQDATADDDRLVYIGLYEVTNIYKSDANLKSPTPYAIK